MNRFLLHLLLYTNLISFSGCKDSVSSFKIDFDPNIKSPVFDKSYLSHIYQVEDSIRHDWIDYNPGDTIIWEDRSKIVQTNFPNIDKEKTYDYFGFIAYKSNDTVFLLLVTTIGSLNVEICNNNYTASEFIFSHSSKRFGKGKNVSSTITIPIKKSRIILKDKSLNVGDRIFAHVYFETEEFLDYGIPNTNYFKGSFTTVIRSKDYMYRLGILPLLYM